jgi:hypothetical protein
MLFGMFGKDHSWHLRARDESRRAHVDGLIKRASLDADCRIAPRRQAKCTSRKGQKLQMLRAAAVGGTAPARAPVRQGIALALPITEMPNAEGDYLRHSKPWHM